MHIRPATIVDLEQCQQLDGSYVTNWVWQMDEARSLEQIGVSFRRVRMPRSVRVPYPRTTAALRGDWQRAECFLVAEELGRVFGFLDMTVRSWERKGWIEHLIVERSHRRCGLATGLLLAAEQWARSSQLEAVVAAVQTKNDPAIRLLVERGYTFGGFIDRHYPNGDIGLLYSLRL